MANYLACTAIETREHYIQLLEALMKIFPPGEGDRRVTQLLSGLACTVYKQLGNLRILRRETALFAA